MYGSDVLAFPPDWNEFLHVLTSHRVRFLLIGGHAVALHATPRFTEDLDVFVDPTPANARRLHAALVEFGFEAVLSAPAALAVPDKVWMLGRKPLRIDILTGIDGVSFRDAWRGRVAVQVGDDRVFVIGRDALLANKRAAGRAKDLADIEAIEARLARRRR